MPFKPVNAKSFRAKSAKLAKFTAIFTPRFSIAQRPAKWEIVALIYN
jgi:hypothetical protein